MSEALPTARLSPEDCLQRLPIPSLDATTHVVGDELRRLELSRSVLAIANVDHVSAIALVRAVIHNIERGQAAGHDA